MVDRREVHNAKISIKHQKNIIELAEFRLQKAERRLADAEAEPAKPPPPL